MKNVKNEQYLSYQFCNTTIETVEPFLISRWPHLLIQSYRCTNVFILGYRRWEKKALTGDPITGLVKTSQLTKP